MGTQKELFTECEMKFGEVVRAARDKDPNALWLLFEYIEFRLTKQKEYENAGATKRNDKKETRPSGSDESDQFSFNFDGN